MDKKIKQFSKGSGRTGNQYSRRFYGTSLAVMVVFALLLSALCPSVYAATIHTRSDCGDYNDHYFPNDLGILDEGVLTVSLEDTSPDRSDLTKQDLRVWERESGGSWVTIVYDTGTAETKTVTVDTKQDAQYWVGVFTFEGSETVCDNWYRWWGRWYCSGWSEETYESCFNLTVDHVTTNRCYKDEDGDGYVDLNDFIAVADIAVDCPTTVGGVDYIARPAGQDRTDCDDTDPAIHPGATDDCANKGVDDDCDGTVDEDSPVIVCYPDADSDKYGEDTASGTDRYCECEDGEVDNKLDCDDTDENKNPAIASDGCGNGDEDCDSDIDEDGLAFTCYPDVDNDGYGDSGFTGVTRYCECFANETTNNTDCDDLDFFVHPGGSELCGPGGMGNGVDDNCDGTVDEICGPDAPSGVCANIADTPLSLQVSLRPPLVMLVVDDSGSMTFEVLFSGAKDGMYMVSGSEHAYVHDRHEQYPWWGARTSGSSGPGDWWKTQCYSQNLLYYNPSIPYTPWAGMSDADIENPMIHPLGSSYTTNEISVNTTSMTSSFDTMDWRDKHGNQYQRSINFSHYYMEVKDKVYMVILDPAGAEYFEVFRNASNRDDVSYLLPLTNGDATTAGIKVSDLGAARQNFANWYQYYRTRRLSANNALSEFVSSPDADPLKVGILEINESGSPIMPRLVADDRAAILDDIQRVDIDSRGGNMSTPLRSAYLATAEMFARPAGSSAPEPLYTAGSAGSCQHAFAIVMTDGYYTNESISVGNADSGEGTPFADKFSNTMADISWTYYDTDLQPKIDDFLPTSTEGEIWEQDLNTAQHLVTYGISFGLKGNKTSVNGSTTWDLDPTSDANPDAKIDDLWHAAVNGRGDYLSAENSTQLNAAFKAILQEITKKERSGASVSINTQTLEDGSKLYNGTYVSDGWSGDLRAYSLSKGSGSVADTPSWSAADELDALSSPATSRNIYTSNGTGMVNFDLGNLSAGQQAMLMKDYNVVDYIKGKSISHFRLRGSILGDIIHSAPVHANNAVFIGANDGMMHAFNDKDGSEIFAYIPSFVYPNLFGYVMPEYSDNHKYFVDGTPYVTKVNGDYILLGGLGKGGKGYYCLDVTKTVETASPSVGFKWEFPTGSDPYMGFSYSRAAIVNTQKNGYVAIFGNGYDSDQAEAALYVVDVDTGILLTRIETGVGDPTVAKCNGLSTPVLVDIDFDGAVDLAYAGDLLGNLWKFDLRGDVGGWRIAHYDGGRAVPMFQARDSSGNPQPITTKPVVSEHCLNTSTKYYGLIVSFGTGKYISLDDFGDTSPQTIYGIWDWDNAWAAAGVATEDKYLGEYERPYLGNIDGNSYFNSPNVQDLDLLTQATITVGGSQAITNNKIEWFSVGQWLNDKGDGKSYDGGRHVGWRLDLPDPGERVVADPVIRGGYLFYVSIVPSASPCSPGGYSYLNVLNVCSGARPDGPIVDINGDGELDADDTVSGIPPKPPAKEGIYYTPVFLTGDDFDKMYLDADDPTDTRAEALGMVYWRLLQE